MMNTKKSNKTSIYGTNCAVYAQVLVARANTPDMAENAGATPALSTKGYT